MACKEADEVKLGRPVLLVLAVTERRAGLISSSRDGKSTH